MTSFSEDAIAVFLMIKARGGDTSRLLANSVDRVGHGRLVVIVGTCGCWGMEDVVKGVQGGLPPWKKNKPYSE